MFSGKKIGSSTNPNTFPLKFRRNETINLAKDVYDYLVSNNYSFTKRPKNKLEFFDYLIEIKLSENLSVSYLKALKTIARCLREQLVSKGHITPEYVDSLSLRHSKAIEIFKRTGSLSKLQKAMGHSSLNVSLTYLRGLEVAELKEEDMPMV